jgi:hypothetical protein
MYTFRLGDRVNELKNTLGETKYEDDRLNKAQQNVKTPLRKPKEYDFGQRQVIVKELNSFLNPFPVLNKNQLKKTTHCGFKDMIVSCTPLHSA